MDSMNLKEILLGSLRTMLLAQIMGGVKFKECVVVITTRPWRVDKILNNPKLEEKFTFVTVEGFAEDNMKEYAGKVLSRRPVHGNESSAIHRGR